MKSPARPTFVFGPSCTLAQAETLRYALLGKLQGSRAKSLHLDLTAVEEADVTLLQTLVALRRTAGARGVALVAATNPFLDGLLAVAGLAAWNAA